MKIMHGYIHRYQSHINQRVLFMIGMTLNREDEVSCCFGPFSDGLDSPGR